MSICPSVWGWLLAAFPSNSFLPKIHTSLTPSDLPRAPSSIQSQATVPSFRAKRSADRAGPCSCMHRSVNSSSVTVWSPSMSSLLGVMLVSPMYPYVSLRIPMCPYVSLGFIRFGWCWSKLGVKPTCLLWTLGFAFCQWSTDRKQGNTCSTAVKLLNPQTRSMHLWPRFARNQRRLWLLDRQNVFQTQW